MPFGFEITFTIIFVAVVACFLAANTYLNRALKHHLGEELEPTTTWSRRVEAVRTRIEAQSLARVMRGQPPIDKDAELRRRLEVPEPS